MPIKFLNCNRRQVLPSEFRPYDLVTVDNDKELDNEYFTISAQGVVQIFRDKSTRRQKTSVNPTEFLSLSEWMQQTTMFNVLTSMKFFKHYLISKVFRLWKGNVRYRMYKRTRQDLAKQLIFTRPDFLPKYMEINKLLFEMQSKTTFFVPKLSQIPIDEFMTSQRTHHEQVKSFYKEKVEDNIKTCLSTLIHDIEDSRTLREEEDLENTKKGKAEKKKSIVLQKEEKNLKNQVLRLARMNYKSIGIFIRLIDYRVVETQVRINQEGAELILSEMDNSNKKYFIDTQISFDSDPAIDKMSFNPDQSLFKTHFEKLLLDMQGACEDVQPINTQQDLQSYINGLITDSAPRFKYITENSFKYQTTKDTIIDRLLKDFEKLQNDTKNYSECHPIHLFEQTFKFEDFTATNPSVDQIKDRFKTWQAWENLIAGCIKPQVY
jgi:dynein heavy chain